MLDLKKLEEKLDLALASETSESLTNWLQEKRFSNFLYSLGEGTFVNIFNNHTETLVGNQNVIFEVSFSSVTCNQENQMAA